MNLSRTTLTALLSAAVAILPGACKRGQGGESLGEMQVKDPAAADPAFDESWKALEDKEAFYIEADRGDGLMGRVLRSDPNRPPSAADLRDTALGVDPKGATLPPTGAGGAPAGVDPLPEKLVAGDLSALVRVRMANVKFCYLSVTRTGRSLSGRAIVSFTVGRDGTVGDVRVDAPAFRTTDLAACVSKQVQRWAFPKSRNGGLAVSYPIVFVGG